MLLCVCVWCVGAHMCVCMYTWVFVEARGQPQIFLRTLLIFWDNSSLGPGGSQMRPSWLFLCRNPVVSASLTLELQACATCLDFYLGSVDQTLLLMLVRQALYQLNCLLRPPCRSNFSCWRRHAKIFLSWDLIFLSEKLIGVNRLNFQGWKVGDADPWLGLLSRKRKAVLHAQAEFMFLHFQSTQDHVTHLLFYVYKCRFCMCLWTTCVLSTRGQEIINHLI